MRTEAGMLRVQLVLQAIRATGANAVCDRLRSSPTFRQRRATSAIRYGTDCGWQNMASMVSGALGDSS